MKIKRVSIVKCRPAKDRVIVETDLPESVTFHITCGDGVEYCKKHFPRVRRKVRDYNLEHYI